MHKSTTRHKPIRHSEVNMHRKAQLLTVLAAALIAAPAAAEAHVSLHPNTIPAGAFVTLSLRVPGEQQGAHVTKVQTLFPAGFISADYAEVPGWSTKVTDSKLATPVQTDDGPIDTQVSQITWTWTGPTGRVDDGRFVEFPLSVAIPDSDNGKSLAFKTVQTYSDGTVAHWIGPVSADQPAPTVNVTAKGGVIEDVAGGEAGPTPGQLPAGQGSASTPAAHGSGGASQGLGVAALILGALGLLSGLVALHSARRRRAD